ncbi:MAG TPA: GFA family protein [Candidatus Paceibacterota bacterium]
MKSITGACGCGAITFTAEGDIVGVVSCHCKFCQRLHGNYNPMVIVEKGDFALRSADSLEWYDSSNEARRGFCRLCGSALFKEQKSGSKILISIGSLDDTSGWKNTKNVFTEEAGAYYEMPNG